MDKRTLAAYGWIVIISLVLAVMLSFATPFGKFIARAVGSVSKGFEATRDYAMGNENMEALESEWEKEFEIPKAIYYGDLDKDGDIDEDDERVLSNHAWKASLITDSDTLKRADLNGDGEVDSEDVATISRYLQGIITTFPVEE